MGLFDIFSRSPSRRIERLTKRMLNEHHQQQVRQESMEELVSIDTPESILALIQRLGVNFRDSIKNEQEKRWVGDVLVNTFGQRAIEPLIAFIRTEQGVSAAIRTLGRLIDAERLVGILVETLTQYAPEDHRSVDARLQLIDALADHDDPRVVPAVLPYALDHDDSVRAKVIDVLEDRVREGHAQHRETIDRLLDVLEDPEASSRITRRAAAALVALGGDLGARADAVGDVLPDGFSVVDGRLKEVR